jgi:predicted O-methyltransferase YrrM
MRQHLKHENSVRTRIEQLAEFFDLPSLPQYVDELKEQKSLKNSIELAVENVDFFRTKHWNSNIDLGMYRVTEYALTRAIEATRGIETGVLHGLSSAFLLHAMFLNENNARLISIDYPSNFENGPSNQDGFDDTLPPGQLPGWTVGEAYRPHWDLRLGKSTDLLAPAIAEFGEIDIFVHDSEHTFATMMYEFETVWPHIREGGFLVADNIDVNTSFFDFCFKINRLPIVMPADSEADDPRDGAIRFGIVRK